MMKRLGISNWLVGMFSCLIQKAPEAQIASRSTMIAPRGERRGLIKSQRALIASPIKDMMFLLIGDGPKSSEKRVSGLLAATSRPLGIPLGRL